MEYWMKGLKLQRSSQSLAWTPADNYRHNCDVQNPGKQHSMSLGLIPFIFCPFSEATLEAGKL